MKKKSSRRDLGLNSHAPPALSPPAAAGQRSHMTMKLYLITDGPRALMLNIDYNSPMLDERARTPDPSMKSLASCYLCYAGPRASAERNIEQFEAEARGAPATAGLPLAAPMQASNSPSSHHFPIKLFRRSG